MRSVASAVLLEEEARATLTFDFCQLLGWDLSEKQHLLEVDDELGVAFVLLAQEVVLLLRENQPCSQIKLEAPSF